MDFLDPKKQKQHSIRLAIGYTFMGIALLLATTVLLYRAYGYGLDKDGRVIQNGIVFVSTLPTGADIYVNNQKYKDASNTRLSLPGGQYTFQLKRDGYRSWQRAITVEGGSVGRFDYPVLFPEKLVTTVTKQYAAAPLVASQSTDQRWLLVQAGPADQFDLYDLDVDEPTPKAVAVPADILTPAATTQDWEVVEWAGDNRHVILKRTFQKDAQARAEYILFDRGDPTKSRNLSIELGVTPARMAFRNKKSDQYYLHDQNSSQLLTATLDEPTPKPLLTGVLTFETTGDSLLYATTTDAPAGRVLLRLRQGDDTHTLRQVPAGTNYLLKLASYKDALFVAVGAQSENREYIYKNPGDILADDPKAVLVPVQILKVDQPSYVSFSPNARFVLVENADRFAVYDAETDKMYGYQIKQALDAPQTNASWMDSYHLQVVSGGVTSVFDFDGANAQQLSPANPGFAPAFDRNHHFVYTLTPQHALSATALLTPEDQ
jgi:hypothetical protein